jgi:hypothetical protein
MGQPARQHGLTPGRAGTLPASCYIKPAILYFAGGAGIVRATHSRITAHRPGIEPSRHAWHAAISVSANNRRNALASSLSARFKATTRNPAKSTPASAWPRPWGRELPPTPPLSLTAHTDPLPSVAGDGQPRPAPDHEPDARTVTV